MDEKRMNGAESLELITSMINDSRARMTQNLGTPFLIWGYVTVVVSLLQALAIVYVDNLYSCLWGWLAIPVMGWLLMLLFNKRKYEAVNYIDRCVGAVWTAIGVAAILVPFVSNFGISVFSDIVILMGVGTFITAAVIKDRCIKRIGLAAIVSSSLFPLADFVLSRFLSFEQFCGKERYLVECVIFALIMFLLLVVPGHMLNRKKNV